MGPGQLPRPVGPGSPPAAGGVCNVARFLPAIAARQPDALALRLPRGRTRDGGIRYLDLSFARLEAETNAWAARLAAAGVTRGTRVLLLVTPGLSLIALCFALFKTGAAPVVIDPGMGLKRFLACVAHSRPQALVAIPKGIWLARLFRRGFAGVDARLTVRPHQPLTRADAPPPAPIAPAATRPDELAAILFTSGSTGPAKGVRYEHGMFEAQVRAIRDAYVIEPGEVDLPMLPIFALFNPALGMTTVVPEMNPGRPAAVDPAAIVRAIRQCGVTNSFGSPVLWRKIGDHCLRHGLTLPSLKRILMAGAPAPPSLLADFRKILPHGTVHVPYGATEALPVTSITDREVLESTAAETLRGAGTCVGAPLAGVDVRLLRPTGEIVATWDDALAAPAGSIGEIVVRGATATRAYDGLPEATARSKIAYPNPPDGGPAHFHRMGDAGRLDEAGRLWFCGRMAERVVAHDGVHYTECCEPVFNVHPRVARTALIALGSARGIVPALVIEPKPGCWPRSQLARLRFVEELRALGVARATTRTIDCFFFHRRFPVDVRHNAKIHRLELARLFARRRPILVP